MKVQKRDGRIVEYNADKITAAIKKANVEVDNSQKVSDDLIEEAIGNVEKSRQGSNSQLKRYKI